MCEPLPVPNTIRRGESTQIDLPSEAAASFALGAEHKSYRHQFSNLYFARLILLKKIVEQNARERWRGMRGSPPLVPRVLDVVKSQVCFIVGTVYMNMPQKPNVLEDIGRDRYLPDAPAREKYLSPEDEIVLEDDSGRILLVGDTLQRVIDDRLGEGGESIQTGWGNVLVTGVIMAALGRETLSGAFEVKDVCFPGMAPMLYKNPHASEDMEIDAPSHDEWVAFVSGLEMGPESTTDLHIQMLFEYLSAEAGAQEDSIPQISRLVIAGNSLAPVAATSDAKSSTIETGSKSKRFGQEASNFSPVPTSTLGDFLYDVANMMPVHLLPGAKDPSSTLLPQQSLPRAMFGDVRTFENFICETNPAWIGLKTDSSNTERDDVQRLLFVHSGQAIDDMYKYVPSPPTTRLDLACATLQWRHVAPTAPDTLWCFPYLTTDPFVLRRTPDLYVVGCQPEFATRLVSSNDFSDNSDPEGERRCRVVLVPAFKDTGCLVLVNMRNLEVKCVEFGLTGRLKTISEVGAENV